MNFTDSTLWPKPGIYRNIPAEQYHALTAVSSSKLKSYRNLPATCNDPFVGSWETTLGSASHAYSIEGPDVFHAQYVVAPEFEAPASFSGQKYKATKEYKDRVAEFQAKNAGREILDAEQGAAVMGLDKSLREHPASRRFMETDSIGELSVLWFDEGTGLLCKARIDWYIDEIPTDYKTTAQIDRFYSQILNLNYDVQGGHYSAGLLAHGLPVKAFSFLVGETSNTNRVRTGFLGGGENGRAWLDASIDESKRLIGLYAESLKLDIWPNFRIPNHAYSLSQIQEFDLFEEWTAPGGRFAL